MNNRFVPGARVRIIGRPVGVVLQSSYGTVVGPDDLAGYVIVRLDEPAINDDGPRSVTRFYLEEVRESVDNLEVVE